MLNISHPKADRGYISIADHGLIGNLRTAALVSIDGSIESYCVPNFDSPSIFARILDKDKGGHFSITPCNQFTTKQNYLPSSNILQTKYLNDKGVATVTDFLPRNPSSEKARPLLAWLIRRVEVIRGSMPIRMECAPAFNYARSPHKTTIIPDTSIPPTFPPSTSGTPHPKVLFASSEAGLTLDLRYVTDTSLENIPEPEIELKLLDLTTRGHLGLSAYAEFTLYEGQSVTFILRTPPDVEIPEQANPSPEKAKEIGVSYEKLVLGASTLRPPEDPILTKALLRTLFEGTNRYWTSWIRRSTYKGSWKEAVHRSALALKLLIYEPTGAVVASPTFSLPEYIGGTRNWDYRASWIRDSSFTLYALIRLGFTHEANDYMEFIFDRVRDKNPDGSLNIMYTIHGEKNFPEEELTHLDGHKGSKPVRIGNGAIDHVQLDIYGELMDCIYLSQKFGKPLGYDTWVVVREIVDFVIANMNKPDLSIWEVRGRHRHFTYSKIMLWVAIDRGIRLADKRSLPCPRRNEWLAARDALYEEIMAKAWNAEKRFFAQSYEDKDVLDSSLLIMPLVFFSTPADPRFLSTLKQILNTPERGGLTSNGLVYRYDSSKTDDGVGGEEGTFCLCTLWCVEALGRAGAYDKQLLTRAIAMFEDFLQYTNHVGLCTEEISDAGEALGNAVQGFTHVTLISAAYNLSRMQEEYRI
ncbi:glycoside hydrolase family 15 protein [Gelatoporia subvermispora B]|uniref:Glycoside hydrolase family 15 protein n=1 Tax=Ceriporiopsis subvermispora (strain B) TaxID=914234 RepID=M2R4Q1_CERS8|nr:glycoside hydrolase family 15 protein [Gelatoporia subvermispora B]